jgi:acetyl-CoA carboxylase biotin carboxyl carrier protein
MALSDEDVREILRLIDESQLDELRIETAGFRLHMRRGGVPPTEDAAPVQPPVEQAADGAHTIAAPMLGSFYRAEAPGAQPFVDVGTRVEPDTVVCLIEVMKMMNSVQAGVEGTIVEVCADNAQLVEPGEPLFLVEPGVV